MVHVAYRPSGSGSPEASQSSHSLQLGAAVPSSPFQSSQPHLVSAMLSPPLPSHSQAASPAHSQLFSPPPSVLSLSYYRDSVLGSPASFRMSFGLDRASSTSGSFHRPSSSVDTLQRRSSCAIKVRNGVLYSYDVGTNRSLCALESAMSQLASDVRDLNALELQMLGVVPANMYPSHSRSVSASFSTLSRYPTPSVYLAPAHANSAEFSFSTTSSTDSTPMPETTTVDLPSEEPPRPPTRERIYDDSVLDADSDDPSTRSLGNRHGTESASGSAPGTTSRNRRSLISIQGISNPNRLSRTPDNPNRYSLGYYRPDSDDAVPDRPSSNDTTLVGSTHPSDTDLKASLLVRSNTTPRQPHRNSALAFQRSNSLSLKAMAPSRSPALATTELDKLTLGELSNLFPKCLHGEMEKRSSALFFKSFKQYFFLLTPHRLYYFKAKRAEEPVVGAMVVDQHSTCNLSSKYRKRNVFEVARAAPARGDSHDQDSAWLLRCASEADATAWINAINLSVHVSESLDRPHGAKVQPPLSPVSPSIVSSAAPSVAPLAPSDPESLRRPFSFPAASSDSSLLRMGSLSKVKSKFKSRHSLLPPPINTSNLISLRLKSPKPSLKSPEPSFSASAPPMSPASGFRKRDSIASSARPDSMLLADQLKGLSVLSDTTFVSGRQPSLDRRNTAQSVAPPLPGDDAFDSLSWVNNKLYGNALAMDIDLRSPTPDNAELFRTMALPKVPSRDTIDMMQSHSTTSAALVSV
ncbi:uncharacterized protein BJ171DRAFT_587641 [Polychytrium aggregatum]|uniref:uncharacterized protein n=1 Tax=Polychytrium aggregatum TaxID=110093 RepID=UPI0022FE71BF|nr:uncharacterized protein BJ171DRAFT_587641 [Polychytrium aggregatum]KAI9193362.1 hypothetical protein BJ171DRAFT_587641 [Polychytrium aggregatum]